MVELVNHLSDIGTLDFIETVQLIVEEIIAFDEICEIRETMLRYKGFVREIVLMQSLVISMLPAEEVATPFIKKEVEHSEDIYQGHL